MKPTQDARSTDAPSVIGTLGWVGVVVLCALVAAGCGSAEARKRAQVCSESRKAAVDQANAELQELAAAEPELVQKRMALESAAAAAEKRLAALTIKRQDATSAYPDRVKGRVAAVKMRMASIQAWKRKWGLWTSQRRKPAASRLAR